MEAAIRSLAIEALEASGRVPATTTAQGRFPPK
jgi:hypothetical protein